MQIFKQRKPEQIIDSEIICVIGRRGSGKTTLAKAVLIPSFPRFIIFDQLDEYADMENVSIATNKTDLIELIEIGENIRIPSDTIPFETVTEIVNKIAYNYYLVVDEFHMLFQFHMRFLSDYPAFRNIVLTGRHSGVGLLLITQRPTHIPMDVLSQATKLYVFNVYHKNDIKHIAAVINTADELTTLNQFEYEEITIAGTITRERKKLIISVDKSV